MGELREYPDWKASVTELLNDSFSFGDIVPHEWFVAAFRMKPKAETKTFDEFQTWNLEYMSNIDRMKDHLLKEHCMYLHNVPREGYMLAPPKDQVRIVMRKAETEMRRTMTKAQAGVTYVRPDMLDDVGRREQADAQAKLAFFRVHQLRSISS